ncbi:MAG: hypothetical protein U0183_22870 [Polyangiaceae bacterium]
MASTSVGSSAGGYRLTAESAATERIVGGSIERRAARIVETSSADGKSFGPERVLLDDATVRSPSRVVMPGGASWLFVVDDGGRVRVAKEKEGAFALEPEPVFAIDPAARPDAALGVLAAEVRRVGDELLLLYAAGSGGLDRRVPLRTAIGLARSRDGVRFVDGGRWLLAQERTDEAGGFGWPSLAVHDGAMHLYFTKVDARHEPTIGHARCAL